MFKVYGLQKVTLLDYPENVASTIFIGGCNLRCPYCHNPELVIPDKSFPVIKLNEIYDYLDHRKNLLNGVCITGGEPLLYPEIINMIEKIKSYGLKVKIDTNGTNPGLLKSLKVDYIAMDIKTSFEKYILMGYTGQGEITELISESINYIINSGIEHEFRTTIVPEIVDLIDIKQITGIIKNCNRYFLQQFKITKILNPEFEKIKPYDDDILIEMRDLVLSEGISCEIRGL